MNLDLVGMAVSTGIGLTIGNFLWQLSCPKREWIVAFERSWYQAVALAIFTLVLHVTKLG